MVLPDFVFEALQHLFWFFSLFPVLVVAIRQLCCLRQEGIDRLHRSLPRLKLSDRWKHDLLRYRDDRSTIILLSRSLFILVVFGFRQEGGQLTQVDWHVDRFQHIVSFATVVELIRCGYFVPIDVVLYTSHIQELVAGRSFARDNLQELLEDSVQVFAVVLRDWRVVP